MGIAFTIVSLYVEAKYIRSIFFWIGIFAIFVACFLAFKKIYDGGVATVGLDVDFNRSRVHIKDGKSHPPEVLAGRKFVVVDCIEVDVRARFSNSSPNSALVTGVDAALQAKRFFRRQNPIGEWNTPLGEPLEGIRTNGLPVPGSCKTDYKLLRWAIGIKENPRPIILDSGYELVLTIHILAQQDHQERFFLDWEDDHWAKLSRVKKRRFPSERG